MPGTVWGAAQAVTYHTTHDVRAATHDEAAIFGRGSADAMQETAWWALLTADGNDALARQTVKVFRA